jgi:hypothetical protein
VCFSVAPCSASARPFSLPAAHPFGLNFVQQAFSPTNGPALPDHSSSLFSSSAAHPFLGLNFVQQTVS